MIGNHYQETQDFVRRTESQDCVWNLQGLRIRGWRRQTRDFAWRRKIQDFLGSSRETQDFLGGAALQRCDFAAPREGFSPRGFAGVEIRRYALSQQCSCRS
jgi:hypothetical protein